MNLQKEKEAFEAWVVKNIASDKLKSWEDWCWEAWQAAKAQANKHFENFIDQAIEDSACADERQSLHALLDDFQDIVKIEVQEQVNP